MEIDELKNKYYTEATVSVFLSEQEQNKLLAEALSAANQASVAKKVFLQNPLTPDSIL